MHKLIDIEFAGDGRDYFDYIIETVPVSIEDMSAQDVVDFADDMIAEAESLKHYVTCDDL
jgi:hypothetical protein